jgi:hypothetical protein
MINNTAQAQMPNHVGIYPPFYALFHGQLYGAFSRTSSCDNADAVIIKRHQQYTKNDRYTTPNTLYQEVV